MKHLLRRSIPAFLALVIVLSTLTSLAILPAQNAYAADIDDPTIGLENYLKRWLLYRGMYSCLEKGFHNSVLDRDDVDSGHWNPANDKEGFGYIAKDLDDLSGNDGTVKCDDGSIFYQSASDFKYSSRIDFMCAYADKIHQLEGVDNLVDYNGDPCKESTDWVTRGIGDERWQEALTKTLDEAGINRPTQKLNNVENTTFKGALWYLLGKRSLETFCSDGRPLEQSTDDLANNSNRVRVRLVDSKTGQWSAETNHIVYGDRDENSTVKDVFPGDNVDEADDKKCYEIARWVGDYSGHYQDFSNYVIVYYNNAVVDSFKDSLEVTSSLKKDLCGDPPTGGGEIPGPPERAYAACVNRISTRWDQAIDQCRAQELDGKAMAVDERTRKMKGCLRQALPSEYNNTIDRVDAPNVNSDDDAAISDGDSETSCAIDGVGWIVCPLMNFMAELNEKAFGVLTNFLEVEDELTTNASLRVAWSTFRDMANVAFVIAFLIIIYSQITGAGITNYGIKRLMPKMIIAAVLVNASLFLCQIAVDLSNIVGGTVYNLLVNLANADSASTNAVGNWSETVGDLLAKAAIGVGILIAIFVAPTALLAVGVVVLILMARKAIIILLIVIAPLAFVAYLLPNTEDWFKKWWKMFSTLLMLFPVVGLVFGASSLAAGIINNVAGDADGGVVDDQHLLQLTALGIMAVPLFAVPVVLKGALSAAGSIGQRLSGLQDRANRRAGADLKKSGKDMKNRFNTAAQDPNNKWGKRLGGVSRWNNRRALGRRDRETAAGRAAELGYSNAMIEKNDDGTFTKRAERMKRAAAGGIGVANKQGKVRAEAFATQRTFKQWDDDVSAFGTTQTNDSHDKLLEKQNNKSLSVEERAAAAGSIAKRSYRKGHNDSLRAMHAETSAADDTYRAADVAYKAAQKTGDSAAMAKAEAQRSSAKQELDTLNAIQKQFASDWKEKSFGMGDSSMGDLVEGKYGRINTYTDDAGNPMEARADNIYEETRRRTENKLTAKTVATLNPDDLKIIYNDAVENGNNGADARTLTDSEMQNLVDKIFEARSHPETKKDIKPEADAKFDEIIQKAIARGLSIPQPPSP